MAEAFFNVDKEIERVEGEKAITRGDVLNLARFDEVGISAILK